MINFIFLICFSYFFIICYYCAPMSDHLQINNSQTFNGDYTLTTSSSNYNSKCLNNQQSESASKSVRNGNFVPEEVLIRLSQITDGDQLIDYLTETNNQSRNVSTKSSHNKRKPRNINRKSKSWLDHFPGTCSPENQTQVIKAPQGKSEIYFPGCIKIPKCSGCCPSDRLTCQPTDTSNVSVEVMVLRYIPHSRRFKYSGRQRFTFEGHNQCECRCIQKEADCTSNQLYKKEECRCVCHDLSGLDECTSNPTKYWDSSTCSCKCLHHHNCSSGLHFNEKTCSCDTLINGSIPYQPGSTNTVNTNQLIDQVNNLNNSKTNAPSQPTSLWDYPDTFNLLSGNVQDGEYNEMDKLHRSMGFQGINPSSSSVSSAVPSS